MTTPSSVAPVVVWLRQDLRLADNPALAAAVASGRPVVPLYIQDDGGPWAPGAALRCWVELGLAPLAAALERRGSRLILRRGDSAATLAAVIAECGAGAVYWNRRYEPAGVAVDAVLKQELGARLEVRTFNGRLLFEPFTVQTAEGAPYRVFTPFHRACLKAPAPAAPLPAPQRLAAPATWPAGVPRAALGLTPRPDWAGGIRARWPAGEEAALARLDAFIEGGLTAYPERRDLPGEEGVSALSPYLAVGALSPRQAWHAVKSAPAAHRDGRAEAAAAGWLRQLVWREFAYHLLYHFPHTVEGPLRPEFERMEWLEDGARLAAWQRGLTGVPLVDAGMRELWSTGYMHNRVRMVVASYLCKHLGQHWLAGARWFWDTLIDADLANNTLGWQWTAGCGADAAPYFRVFNPVSQARKFDPEGRYLRRWVAELANLPADRLHDAARGVPGYPAPLVDLARGRAEALARYARMRA